MLVEAQKIPFSKLKYRTTKKRPQRGQIAIETQTMKKNDFSEVEQ